MILYPLILSLFFLFFLILQILILEKGTFDDSFLKKGKDVKVSTRFVIITTLSLVVLLWALYMLFAQQRPLDQILYTNTFLYTTGIFLIFFIIYTSKNQLQRFFVSLLCAVLLVCLALLTESNMLKNIVTVGSLLWVSFLCFRYLKINRIYLIAFLEVFMVFDMYNVLVLHPVLATTSYYLFFDGYIEFGRHALGMGDFFVAFLAIGLVWADRGIRRSIVLACLIAAILFTITSIGFTVYCHTDVGSVFLGRGVLRNHH